MGLVVDCSEPVVSKWTVLSQSSPFQYNNTVTFTCMEGYEFQDDGWSGNQTTIQCMGRGVWSVPRIPTCQRKHHSYNINSIIFSTFDLRNCFNFLFFSFIDILLARILKYYFSYFVAIF